MSKYDSSNPQIYDMFLNKRVVKEKEIKFIKNTLCDYIYDDMINIITQYIGYGFDDFFRNAELSEMLEIFTNVCKRNTPEYIRKLDENKICNIIDNEFWKIEDWKEIIENITINKNNNVKHILNGSGTYYRKITLYITTTGKKRYQRII